MLFNGTSCFISVLQLLFNFTLGCLLESISLCMYDAKAVRTSKLLLYLIPRADNIPGALSTDLRDSKQLFMPGLALTDCVVLDILLFPFRSDLAVSRKPVDLLPSCEKSHQPCPAETDHCNSRGDEAGWGCHGSTGANGNIGIRSSK